MKRFPLGTWSLQDRLTTLVTRWYLGAAAIAAGALLGLALSYLLPARFEARLPLSVAFNADARFMTPDDYKNWQMEQLEDFVLSDSLLRETLDGLREQDPAWADVGMEALRESLAPRWRNAGVWHLTAVSDEPARASALVESWYRVVLPRTAEALEHAQAFNLLDYERALQIRELADIQHQAAALDSLEGSLLELAARLEGTDEPLTAQEKAAAFSLANQLAGLNSAYPPLPQGEGRGDYAAWTRQALSMLAGSREALAARSLRAQESIADLSARWLEEKTASGGLSAYLLVEAQRETAPLVTPLRASGLWALSGALAGLFGWLLIIFARLPARNQDPE